VNPFQVSARILNELRKCAERTLGDELQGVVITVPAYFDDAQCLGTQNAATLAGLKICAY
jgi:molecular chaperone HscA